MVRTRHSLPSASTAKAPSPIPTNLTPKAAKALKKLQIHAKDALIGEKKVASNNAATTGTGKQTYHYRRAVYEIDESTDQAWIEEQPKRYLKGNDDVDAQAGAEDDEEDDMPPTKKAKRTSTAGKKRKRVTEPEEPINTSKVFNFTDVGGREERPILGHLPSWVPESNKERRERLAADKAAGRKRPRHEVLEEIATRGVKISRVPEKFPTFAEIRAVQERRETLEERAAVIKIATQTLLVRRKYKEYQKAAALNAQIREEKGLPPIKYKEFPGLSEADAQILAAVDELLKAHDGAIAEAADPAAMMARTSASKLPVPVVADDQDATDSNQEAVENDQNAVETDQDATETDHKVRHSPPALPYFDDDDVTAGAEMEVDDPTPTSNSQAAESSPDVPTPEIARNVLVSMSKSEMTPPQVFKSTDYASLYASGSNSPVEPSSRQSTVMSAPLSLARQPIATSLQPDHTVVSSPTSVTSPEVDLPANASSASPAAPLTGPNAGTLHETHSATPHPPPVLRGANAIPLGAASPDQTNQPSPDPKNFAQLPPNSTLPSVSKAGHELRWTISRRSSEDKAAGSDGWEVFVGRLKGETNEQKRRRVKRELGVVETWGKKNGEQVVKIGGAQAGVQRSRESMGGSSRRESLVGSIVGGRPRSANDRSSISRDSLARGSEMRAFGMQGRHSGGSRPGSSGNEIYAGRPGSAGSGGSVHGTPMAGPTNFDHFAGSPAGYAPAPSQLYGSPAPVSGPSSFPAALQYGAPPPPLHGPPPQQFFGSPAPLPYGPPAQTFGVPPPMYAPPPAQQYCDPPAQAYSSPAQHYSPPSQQHYSSNGNGYMSGKGGKRRQSHNGKYGVNGVFY
ncbi:hypothetical protein B0A48_17813 [Cryoendolithus antarcticus]|uniref:Uncharacterized protein n=1 Tax=Cryoendolithus antarcticus TaxID=1507870 RepID=A0A1V8SBQ9_9PEZI|nr:hypothetical protein B0A48_17813 [Cryoendolithus antarcticus]